MAGLTMSQLAAVRDGLSAAVSTPVRARNPVRRVDTRVMPRSQGEALVRSLTGRPSGIPPTAREATEVDRLVELAKSLPTSTVGPLPVPQHR